MDRKTQRCRIRTNNLCQDHTCIPGEVEQRADSSALGPNGMALRTIECERKMLVSIDPTARSGGDANTYVVQSMVTDRATSFC